MIDQEKKAGATDWEEISPLRAQKLIAKGWQVVDVREIEELNIEQFPDAFHLPMSSLQSVLDKNTTGLKVSDDLGILLICSIGERSKEACDWFYQAGFKRLASLAGGLSGWKSAGLVLDRPSHTFDTERYARQLMLPEVGLSGQKKLLNAKVLLVGVGGLGSPVAQYLSAVGVGHLALIDDDVVEKSNLQRQVLHHTDNVGQKKVDSAHEALKRLNPDVDIKLFDARLDQAFAEKQFEKYDLIIDGSDNFPTRYAVNQACLKSQKPFIYGAVQGFSGQVAFFEPGQAGQACYACLFPETDVSHAGNCSEIGVMGTVPGWVGMMQANMAINWLLGLETDYAGNLYLLDALSFNVRKVALVQDEKCPTCSLSASNH